jgi:Flp pilus assembly protein TadG
MKTIDSRSTKTNGQVLVIFAGGLVLFMAIAALVIDLGFVFMKARHEQNAADPAALAAARYIRVPPSGTPDIPAMWTAACSYATANGFAATRTDTNVRCDPSSPADESRLTVNYPPSRSAGQYAGHLGFVEVVITQPHHSFFAGILGMATIPVTRSAVAAFSRGDSNSSSLIALAPTGCASATIGGSSSLTIHPIVPGTAGGYIQVNSNCGATASPDNACSNGSGALKVNGTVPVSAPHTYVVGSCTLVGSNSGISPANSLTESANFVGDPLTGLLPPTQAALGAVCPTKDQPDPNVGSRTTIGGTGCTFSGSGSYVLAPGTYYGGWKITGSPNVNLQPGIYVIAGGGIRDNGGLLDSIAGPTGNPDTARVLIFSTDVASSHAACITGGGSLDLCQGDMTFSAQSTLSLKGLDSSPCPPISSTGCPYAGLLFWMDGAGRVAPAGHNIVIQAGTSLNIAGTIYDPAGDVGLHGSTSAGGGCNTAPFNCAAVQIIANTFTVDGGNGLDMPYDPSQLYHLDQKGLVR